MMYFQDLSKEHSESCEESCKQNQIRMVTLLGKQVKIQTLDWSDKTSQKVITRGGSGLLDLNQTPVNEPVSDHHHCFFQDLNTPYIHHEAGTSSEKSGLADLTPVCLDDLHGKDSRASPGSCCTTENNNSRTEQEQEDSSDVIQMAAECLLHISAVSLSQNQDLPFEHGSRPNRSSQDQEPSCSCDSYELHTLGISETSAENVFCVSSSKAKDEFNDTKEVGGVKLRRGRRMKSFLKEILPGLVSLSRHEIREDIDILETVLRSREYKKMREKTRDGKCKPNLKSNKGSSHRNVGRRRR